ncbi:AAA family ATPase [Asticcacaulis sp.]|uniref:AAA family ATPase n=1 Tax=Asticcacaulis sp. TaxID=1872648 RepID=UPI00262EC9F7|nr:AAA family ATPase [Asticcacaulis sp.]
MQINRFRAEGVHGYLNFDITINPDLTFLHGINGQGKTTAIRGMVALMNFDISWLARTRFNILSINLRDENRGSIFIQSIRHVDTLKFSVKFNKDTTISVDVILPPIDYLQRDQFAGKIDDDFIMRNARINPPEGHIHIMKYIKSIKKPLFLGLDRTTLTPPVEENRMGLVDRRREINSRTHLDSSLVDAEEIAREAYAEYQRERDVAAVKIKEQIPLILFQPADLSSFHGSAFTSSKIEIRKKIASYKQLRQQIASSYAMIARDKKEIEKVISKYFDALIMEKEKTLGIDFHSRSFTDTEMNAMVESSRLEAALPFIQKIGKLLEDFQRDQEKNYSRFSEYLSIVNDFIKDSGKKFEFSSSGRLSVRLPNESVGDVRSLSSGERQIFVLITHLAFRNIRGERDILIIDEPELSLHLAWQMQFVDAIQRVSPSTQIILATHSPSIIMDREDKCVALTA